jgi:hypothetical protein
VCVAFKLLRLLYVVVVVAFQTWRPGPRKILRAFQVLTAASIKMTVFWNIAPCSHRLDDGSSKHL